MGKKTPEQEKTLATVNENTGGGNPAAKWINLQLEWANYQNTGGTHFETFDDWMEWKANEITRPKFQPPVYEPQEFPQLPVAPSAQSGESAPTAPRGQAPMPQVINRYLESVMKNVGGEGSGQTEVGKALRAKSSGGEQ